MTTGTTLNKRYRILNRVGAGGMASVYRAEDLLLGRVVAVKILHESLVGDELFVRQFQQEAHAAANLTHPNIVTVHDIGQDGPKCYIVMEFVDGHTLKDVIRQYVDQQVYMPVDQVIDLAVQICSGVGYAHRSGVVHCDVKPQNMIITSDHRVKVADFGISRAMTQITKSHSDMMWGTPQYFSPEQAAGESPTPASDVYSIGVMIFEMLTGELPFESESATGYALKHLNEPAPNVTQFNPHVPESIASILLKVMSKEPAGRYRTADQLGRILHAYRQSHQNLTERIMSIPRNPSVITAQPLVTPPADEKTVVMPAPEAVTQVTMPETPPTRPTPAISISPPAETSDWLAVFLGLLTLLFLVGLIPLWFVVAWAWGVF